MYVSKQLYKFQFSLLKSKMYCELQQMINWWATAEKSI